MAEDRFTRMREVYGEAVALAPALRARFGQAGLSPDGLTSSDALNRLPVLKKERLMELQQTEPPFAGYLACRSEEIGHIYASPGPIFEPSLAADKSGHGMNMMFAAAGIGPGDIVLNSRSYHLVLAGLLFDQGARGGSDRHSRRHRRQRAASRDRAQAWGHRRCQQHCLLHHAD